MDELACPSHAGPKRPKKQGGGLRPLRRPAGKFTTRNGPSSVRGAKSVGVRCPNATHVRNAPQVRQEPNFGRPRADPPVSCRAPPHLFLPCRIKNPAHRHSCSFPVAACIPPSPQHRRTRRSLVARAGPHPGPARPSRTRPSLKHTMLAGSLSFMGFFIQKC